jgi:hypothetical protein
MSFGLAAGGLRFPQVALHFLEKRNCAEVREDRLRLPEWNCGAFSITKGYETAGEPEMSLALFQHEAVIGPALGGLLVEVACFCGSTLGLCKDGLAGQHTIDVSGGGYLDAAGEGLGLV